MRSAAVSMGSGRPPTYTRQHAEAETYSAAVGKPAAVPFASRWSRSAVLPVHVTWSRRLVTETGTVSHVTVTCSPAVPVRRSTFVPFSRTSNVPVAPTFTDAADGTTPMRMLPL